MSDSLGDRIKRYEAVSNHSLTPRMPVIIRVDGRAFHTLAKKYSLNKPFDQNFIDSMTYAASEVAKDIQGFKLAYVQSDEATFLFNDYDTLTTEGWFGYKLQKMVSISASVMSVSFSNYADMQGYFDSRAFNVPADDVPNVFIWRQKDWARNSVQMLARSYFSHKELHQKSIADLHEMLYTKGVNWANLPEQHKNGTWITPDGHFHFWNLDYEGIKSLSKI